MKWSSFSHITPEAFPPDKARKSRDTRLITDVIDASAETANQEGMIQNLNPPKSDPEWLMNITIHFPLRTPKRQSACEHFFLFLDSHWVNTVRGRPFLVERKTYVLIKRCLTFIIYMAFIIYSIFIVSEWWPSFNDIAV